jgi:hypothetical protein
VLNTLPTQPDPLSASLRHAISSCSFVVQQLAAALDARLQPAAAAARDVLGLPTASSSSSAAAQPAITSLPAWSDAAAKSFLAAVERALAAAAPAAAGGSGQQAAAASGAFSALHRAWQLVAAQRELQGLAQEAFRVGSLAAALAALQLLALPEVLLEGAAALTAKQRAFRRCAGRLASPSFA